jgi:hypothetical protein
LEKIIVTLVSRKVPIFFAGNWQKSQKIVSKTLTPGTKSNALAQCRTVSFQYEFVGPVFYTKTCPLLANISNP